MISTVEKGFVDINFIERNISKKPNTSVFEVMETDTASVNQKERVADVIGPLINHTYKYLPVVNDEIILWESLLVRRWSRSYRNNCNRRW